MLTLSPLLARLSSILQNAFHVQVRDAKAVLYNDRSVLENHHLAQSYFLLNRPENNIFAELSAKDYAQVRKMIVDLVLATDLSTHFDFLAQFKSSVSSGSLDAAADKLVGPNAFANRMMLHKMALKCGDVGHAAKSRVLHEKWTHRVAEEFYRQGDEERKRGLAISPFMDRQKANLPQSQIGFLEYLVMPLFTAWTKFLELDDDTGPIMVQLRGNRDYWKSQLDDAVEKKDASPSPPPPNPMPTPLTPPTQALSHSHTSLPPLVVQAPAVLTRVLPSDGKARVADSSSSSSSNKVAPASLDIQAQLP